MQELSDYLTMDGWRSDWRLTKSRHESLYTSITQKISKFADGIRNIYRNRLININVNVLVAAYPSIEAAAQCSSILEKMGCTPQAISTLAAITDWAAYIPIHLGLHYLANRKQFTNEDGAFKKRAFLRDAGHVYLTQLPSIGLFYLMAGPLHYHLLNRGMSADTANRVSYWGTMIVTRAVHTIIGFKAGLFNHPQ